ncbi:rplA family protein [Pseudomonas sp. GP01-A8]|nr:rplA family protein [Pseudomonas sp. NC02]PMU24041.1 rplA family protein [Pseudomonas sp. GP01-A9]PMU31011.1 rplA family protein [Pseudomonas sp. GP01-A13]PMU43015.1 rplA family protein [Pseudomonas sp. GP01-A8]PMU50210.1 rplA family protein [Pseudomonas sp. GP01-A14]PMU57814.1 rplA family protein [Pseudomonas sp. GP01-A6]PMU62200.1 rplA family protein [Pseudomonas sp. GP01-A3]PMU77471.1 rplA family protein [Pseudomonas sp. FW215-L2]PMU77669.1 rplA family protein [Pseudomonas sp. GP01-A1
MIVPTLCVGTPPWTLCVRSERCDAERHWMHSHAERGNDLSRAML